MALAALAAATACERGAERDASNRAESRASAPAEFRIPGDAEIPRGELGAAVRRGRALLLDTRDSLKRHTGNDLRCVSCHLDAGTRPGAMPWVGVYARFPQYRARSGRVILIEDRINDCFQRSLNGKALHRGGRDMRDIISYMAFLSTGIPTGDSVPGQGVTRIPPIVPDTAHGAAVFAASCARCHGGGGEGSAAAPPVWGARSFSIGAGMARVRTSAAFIRRNMPIDRPGTLSDRDAYDVAGYIATRPRPDFPGKENDWPNGDPPPDVAYATRAASKKTK